MSLTPAALAPSLRRPEWLNPRILKVEALSGLVVALALIPEAVSFSIIAGVDPRVGLFASFTMAVTIAFTGGRPAMISAATGAIALVVAPLSIGYGVEYLLVAVVLGGLLQVLLAALGVARLMRFLPRSVMVGFVNALAILIFTSQLPYLQGVPWTVYTLLIVGLAVMIGLPRITKAVPAPLVAIVALTGFTVRRGGRADGGGRGRAARLPARPRHPGRAAERGDPADRRPVRPGHRLGRAHRIVDDRQARRRHHRHPLQQDP